jgi:purine-binding chemotaxis protein CheW
MTSHEANEAADDSYLLFYVGKDLYGTPLLAVREVVEFTPPKHMPNMVGHFSGVINIRGAIVGVVDLRKRFGVKSEPTLSAAFLVCDTPQGVLAATVDKVEAVVKIDRALLDRKPPVITQIEQEYLTGIAKLKQGLVTIIELKSALGAENFTQRAA